MPSPNFNMRRPQIVVLHHTAEATFEVALACLKTSNSGGPVSAHYLIGRDGRTAQLVSEDFRAWHAGGGTWGPYRDINSLSIGIELDNNGYEAFPEAQIKALLILLKDITGRYHIAPNLVLGHADIDPVRKVDPNPFFPWRTLAEQGLGLWPDEQLEEPPASFDAWRALRHIGYSTRDEVATLRAFHIHYRGTPTGNLDAMDRRILFNLERKTEAIPPAN
jgi:N-acetylmuramoyl-L-alanine amidase